MLDIYTTNKARYAELTATVDEFANHTGVSLPGVSASIQRGIIEIIINWKDPEHQQL
ncbi:MAG: hypothetical protein ACD_20C00107G0006 [uncultured bacterium]|nr:MAG: hypothetical protein ACD_20C00107G0006 [uncultured bacterium]